MPESINAIREDEQFGPWGVRMAGLILGPLLAIAVHALLPAADLDDAGRVVSGLTWEGRAVAAIGAWMMTWWLTEAIPLPATALLPIAVFPVLGVSTIKAAAAPYADDVIYLFMGGMLLGCAMEKWGLHRRIALRVVRVVGTSPVRLVGGFMIACALVSMWVSNTATAVMMLPVAISVLAMARQGLEGEPGRPPADAAHRRRADQFSAALLLAIAYGCTIGGLGTLIGTPPNIVLANFVSRTYGQEVSFLRWMILAIPLVIVFLPIAWLVLTRVAFRVTSEEIPGVREEVERNFRSLGPMSRGERTVLIIFLATAAAWVLREPLGGMVGIIRRLPDGSKVELLTDPGIAIIAAIVLFVVPVNLRGREFALDWPRAARIPWGILIMFGGGLSLTSAVTRHGVDLYIGSLLAGLGGMPSFAVVVIFIGAVVFATEFVGNTALAVAMMPIAHAAAEPLGVHPFLLVFPCAMAASYAFMMPMGTPPNAIVFSPGHLRVVHMARAGLPLNIAAIALISVVGYWILPLVFDCSIR
ncbi:MAG: SLC13/DASS family transporter [Phycisphaeraceae bacterium]|nr:SLC13/DASS family transporter [Phycisphaerae bacterium]MBX3393267.1 SLC13/DASS family transporter [Phycisphaeraceae bacterium]HRJ49022.1 SLC13 family permease [Phycisphaerales bacterium]